MTQETGGLIQALLQLPIFQAEWVLWLLIALSVASVAVMIERFIFYRRRAVTIEPIRAELDRRLAERDIAGAIAYMEAFGSLETNVVLHGLRSSADGPDAVQDVMDGVARVERALYERRLSFLATTASNAPFIGLFGTVLGIIKAFRDLSDNLSQASSSVMAGIAEALIATAVGLLVAIPAVVAFNVFKGKVRQHMDNMHLLAKTLTAKLKSAALDKEG